MSTPDQTTPPEYLSEDEAHAAMLEATATRPANPNVVGHPACPSPPVETIGRPTETDGS